MEQLNELIVLLRAYESELDEGKLKKCFDLADLAHAGQKRLSGEPYFTHAYSVAAILAGLKMDSDTVCAGLLHDVLEDSTFTFEELKAEAGEQVAQLVEGVTKLSFMVKPDKEIRQADNFKKIFLAMSKDIRVIIIKLADRLHNMRTLQHLADEKRKENAQETLDIFAPLAHRLGMGSIRWELEDLSMKHLFPKEYLEISEMVDKKRAERESLVQEVRKVIEEKLKEQSLKAVITGRAKHFYSIFQKIKRSGKTFDEIYDIIAVRILTESVENCYTILGILHSLFKPIPGQFDDYIAMPKSNMYRSLHTNVIGPNGEPLEIQIRTHEMHQDAEYGIAAHWYYKEGGLRDVKIENKISWIRRLLDWLMASKDSKEFMDTLKLDLFTDEVFVFTPKGEVLELPAGSTPVDFAFAVHTTLGEHCVGAKVNGKMVGFKHQLVTGDIVDILVNEKHWPNPDWLTFVRTNKARQKIRQSVGKSRT